MSAGSAIEMATNLGVVSASSSGNDGTGIKDDADNEDKVNHVFKNPTHDHKLDEFLEKYNGDKVKAYKDLQKATQKYVNENNILEYQKGIVVNVNGTNMTVRGRVVDGIARISTAFIPY